jgi:hypothetical protein
VPSWRDSAKSRITLKSAELCDVALDAVPNRPRKLVGRATTGLRGHESSWAIASVRFDPPGLLQHVKDVILFDVLQRCRGGRAVTIARNVLFLARASPEIGSRSSPSLRTVPRQRTTARSTTFCSSRRICAESDFSGGLPNVGADCRFQPLTIGIDEADYRNRCVADRGCEPSNFVVRAFRTGSEWHAAEAP